MPLIVAYSHKLSKICGSIGGVPRVPLDRLDALVELAQIALLDKRDDGAGLILGRQHLVERQHPHHDLIPLGDSQPEFPAQRFRRRNWLVRHLGKIKQPSLPHAPTSVPP